MTSRESLPAWQRLASLAKAGGPPRAGPDLRMEGGGLLLDLSRQFLGAPVREALCALADQCGFAARRAAMFAGERINCTEDRAVLHTALRAEGGFQLEGMDVGAAVAAERRTVRELAVAIREGRLRGVAGRAFTDVVVLGIGGSSLGPQLVVNALPADGPRLHFVSNVDGAALASTLARLDAATTLFLVVSKTFTTEETLANAVAAQAWLHAGLGPEPVDAHFVAITAHPEALAGAPVKAAHVLRFWDWVGGRFSLWSAAGLPIALAAGPATFDALLAGAHAMDSHFRTAPFETNLPALLGAVGVWNRNFLDIPAHAVLPYAHRLALLPRFLQQLEMESNGKRVDVAGRALNYQTCPLVFGEPGTDAQHSFYQWLHQGTSRCAQDIVVVAAPMSALAGHHQKLLANALAQADALWNGHEDHDGHRHYPGARPVSLIVVPRLDAYHLGALLALYEHKVFTQGVLWGINSFDQMGVELGKRLAGALAGVLSGESPAPQHLAGLLADLARLGAAHR
jgi:glucose-6-phosphate isomerase